jgi:hypothetical protein
MAFLGNTLFTRHRDVRMEERRREDREREGQTERREGGEKINEN